jgi:hypothetical protein
VSQVHSAIADMLTRSRGDGGGGREGEVILLGRAPPGGGGARWVCETEAEELCNAEAAIVVFDEPQEARRRRLRRARTRRRRTRRGKETR